VRQPLGLGKAKTRLGSDYHVSGDGLPQNWMNCIESWRVQYIGVGTWETQGVAAPRGKP
jgi:hypothetical protein